MTIVQAIESVANWLNADVCKEIRLKLPDEYQEGKSYKVEEVSPTAFAMFQPTKEKLPPSVRAPFPSVVVQLLEGADNLTSSTGRLKLQLSFTAWNPGEHSGEFKVSEQQLTAEEGVELGLKLKPAEGSQGFERSTEGWKDVWNFTDATLRKIENAEYIEGLRVVKELGITFGQFNVEGQISDLYPYWGSWVIFTIERGLARTGAAYSEFL